ncbi:MAG: molecular chaperone DjlA, partial [Prevotella sp.]|nr:molecular chaperone DjlA [Prevotella sp.]
MAFAKWIGAILGFITSGPLGALAGYALGSIFESGLDSFSESDNYNNREYDDNDAYRRYQEYQQQGQRNSFLFSLLVLAAYI